MTIQKCFKPSTPISLHCYHANILYRIATTFFLGPFINSITILDYTSNYYLLKVEHIKSSITPKITSQIEPTLVREKGSVSVMEQLVR